MAENIDQVQIEVVASAKGTAAVFSQLDSQLKSLKTAINSINVSKLSGLSKTANSVSINTSGMQKAQKEISSSIDSIKQKMAGLDALKNSALSGDSSSATSFSRRVTSLQSDVDVLKEKLKQLGNTSVPTDAFTELKNQETELENKLTELKSKMASALSGNTTMSNNEFQNLNDELVTTAAQLDTVSQKQQDLINSGQAYYDPFADMRDSLDQLSGDLGTAQSEAQKLKNQTKGIKVEVTAYDAVSTLKDVATYAAKAAAKLVKLSASGIKNGLSSLKSKLVGIKDTLTNIGSTSSNKVTAGFSKILKYAFGIRSLYVLFRRLRTAVKDSFTELQNSGAYYQTTKANIDALKNSLTTLKYQFGAAFEPIFNTVAPALQTLINYLVAVMNTISAFIAKLTGKSTYSKAVVATAEIADNTGSAAGSAAELNKQLQGFDELNNISPDSGSSGGGGSGGSSDSSSVSYVEESVDNALTSFWDSLSDAILSGEWEKAGEIISSALTDALASIEWNDVFSAAADFGTNLADFLNGLISDDLFYQLGKTIANSIKTALIAMLSFGNEFKWDELGTAIASGINGFVDQNPLDLAVDVFNTWAGGILDTLIAAIDNVHWSDIAQHIADGIGDIKASELGEKLGTLVNSISTAVYDLVSNSETWSNLGTKLAEGINSFFTTTEWTKVGQDIKATFDGIVLALTTALDTVDWEEVGQSIADFISGIDWKDVKFKFSKLLSAVKDAIKDILKGASIDAGDIAIEVTKVALLLTAISAVKLGAEVTKKVIVEMLKNKVLATIGANSAAATGGAEAAAAAGTSIGTIATVAGEIALVLAVAIAGWKIGGKLYESATGYSGASQGFFDTVEDLWDGLFSDNKIEFDLSAFIDFTIDDVNNGTGWLKNTQLWKDLTTARDSIKSAWQKLTGTEANTKGYNGAPSEAVDYITITGQDSELSSNYWSSLGEDIVSGIANGIKAYAYTNPFTAPVAWVYDKIKGALADKFQSHSPAKAMYEDGENIFDGIIQGFINAMNAYNWVKLASDLYNHFNGEIKTGLTAQGDFSSDDAISKTHSKTGQSGNGGGSSAKINVTYNTKLTGAATSKQGLSDLKESFNNLSDAASKSTDATYSAKTGGQLQDINSLDTWRQKIKNLISSWTSQSATMRASVGGQMTSIDDTETWIEKIQKLDQEWQNAASTTSFNVTSDVSDLDGQGGYLERLNKAKEKWKGGTAEFNTKLTGSATSKTDIDNLGSSFEKLGKYPSGQHTGTWTTNITGKTASEINSYASAAKNMYDNFYTGSYSASYTLNASVSSADLNTIATQLTDKIKSKLSGKVYMAVTGKALGGIISANGVQMNIPQYAGGTLDAGSVFVAGEAGPEIMGHINGRTEILNRSQIASIMNSSFMSAMGQFGNRLLSSNGVGYNMSSYNANGGYGSNNDGLMMAEQNELLREQNGLLREIASKDVSISSRDIFSATRSEANNYYNRTGNSPFLY